MEVPFFLYQWIFLFSIPSIPQIIQKINSIRLQKKRRE